MNRNKWFSVAALILALVALAGVATSQFTQFLNSPSKESFVGGRFVARNYIYPGIRIAQGNAPAGAASFTMSSGGVRLQDGRSITPFSSGGQSIIGSVGNFPVIPIMIGAGTTREVVSPTAVSGCSPTIQSGGPGAPVTCVVTATFANAHGQGEVVTSGSCGIQEAINDAAFWGGGVVVLDKSLEFACGGVSTVNAVLNGAAAGGITFPGLNVYPGVVIEDDRLGTPTYLTPLGGATTLAAPATLTAVTVGFGLNGANTTGGAYTGGSTYNVCISYVDVMGQEGPCSASFSALTAGSGSTNQIGIAAPAASPGAVGYTPYITLAGGSYGLNYKVPLVGQPAAVGTFPTSNGVCTLTTVETITPACAVTNTSYGQTGSNAIVSALTLNTSPINPQSTVISTTSQYVPQAGGRTTYTYAPASGLGSGGDVPANFLAFTIGAAAGTTVPDVVGTINLRPGAMNSVGSKLRICGELTTTASTATIVDIQFQWDSMGQNTAGKGVLIGDLTATPAAALATAGHATFCQDFITTVASASATGGSINHVNGFGAVGGVSLIAPGALSDAVTPGAVGSLNLAADARINIIYLHTTGTDGAGWTLQNVTAGVI